MLKNKNFLLTVILPIFISIIIGVIVIVLNSENILHTQSSAVIVSEKKQMSDNMSDLKVKKKELMRKAAEYDKTLEDNQILIDEIKALTDELNDYTENIESAKTTITELDSAIADKTAYNESLTSVSGGEIGKSKSYTNIKLQIPSDLKAGRYKAEGKGTLLIYTIAGSLREKQNLSLLDTHSYTFDIASGEAIKIEGTLSITEIIE